MKQRIDFIRTEKLFESHTQDNRVTYRDRQMKKKKTNIKNDTPFQHFHYLSGMYILPSSQHTAHRPQ